jgi:hypothetical protein
MVRSLPALTGFVPITDNGKFPTPAADFVPKRTYAISHDKLWQATLDALDNNRIAVVTSDKTDGRIQTDYVAGPGEVNIALAISQITRYKYNITLRDESDGNVKLNVICTIEDSMSSAHSTSQWRDVTNQNSTLENKLETWLYEQVEHQLKGSKRRRTIGFVLKSNELPFEMPTFQSLQTTENK